MSLRLRKFVGAIGLLVLVVVWALAAMALAQAPAIRENAVAATLYYIIAGLGWVLPAMPLVRWMSGGRTPPRHSGAEPTGPARSGRPDNRLREEPVIHSRDP